MQDTDCKADERCANDDWFEPECDFDSDGQCNCGGLLNLNYTPEGSPSVCLNVGLAGPRGPWQSYRIDDDATGSYWLVSADGSISTNSGGHEHRAALSDKERPLVDQVVSFAWFRIGVANGFPCQNGARAKGKRTLQVADKRYVRNVSDCLDRVPASDIIAKY